MNEGVGFCPEPCYEETAVCCRSGVGASGPRRDANRNLCEHILQLNSVCSGQIPERTTRHNHLTVRHAVRF